MKTTYHLIIGIILYGLVSPSCSSADSAKKSASSGKTAAIKTISSVEELNSVITSANDRLLMFDLYADWCMPCRILSPMLEKIAVEQKDKVTIYKINIDKNPEIAGALRVSGIPFVVYVKNREAVHAFTGVQSKETYVRAIHLLSSPSVDSTDVTPDGEIVAGVRVIRLTTISAPGNIYVYRGETVTLVIDKVEFPYSVHIPAFGISQEGIIGKKLEVTFKAEETGVFPIFCNGRCPSGDGARYGRIIVMRYKGSAEAQFTELTVDDAIELMEKAKPLILDVRTPNEYYSGHIEGAKLIPVSQLVERVSELSAYKNSGVLVYCRSGNRSTVASQILIKNGFKKLYNLRKGVIGWEKAGRPLLKE
jgi:thioredoxin